jgi:hypothetical protein
VQILDALPRAQYIGYTATPFANVFIDPSDAEDLFPSDFVISLRRPRKYMGATDFHDLDPLPDGAEDDPARSNRRAFIRDLEGEDREPDNLPAAVDAWVLSGAIKLYREAQGEGTFAHHTMLVHSSRRRDDHEAMRDTLVDLIRRADYEGGVGLRRLDRMLRDDYGPVSHARPDPEPEPPDAPLTAPATIAELRGHIGETLRRLHSGEPVLIVNSSEQAEDPDFERQPVWKILVGGAKLSRGYTIEGLTVSYFRRRAATADTLMQMGRWFGFRRGYRDLVRVYIGRAEQSGSTTVDLYEAFEGVCRDENDFRAQLARYAMPEDGSSPITPRQIPPLVHSNLPWLPPVSRNKRFNAILRELDFSATWSEKTVAPLAHEQPKLRENLALFASMLQAAELTEGTLSTGQESTTAHHGVVSARVVLDMLRRYKWIGGLRPLQLEIEYLSGEGTVRAQLDDWAVIAPQLARERAAGWHWDAIERRFLVKYRVRVGDRIGAYSEPSHRAMAEHITGRRDAPNANDSLATLRTDRRGVLLFYPVWSDKLGTLPDPFLPIAGFALLFPGARRGTRSVWQVHDPSQPNAVAVEA